MHHILEHRPRHHLQQAPIERIRHATRGLRRSRRAGWMEVVEILTRLENYHELVKRESSRLTRYIRRQIPRIDM